MKQQPHALAKQRGLSLIESMVAVVLTLALIAGVSQMLFGTQTNIRNQNDRANMDDSARFAVEYLSRAGYRAGYKRNPQDSNETVFASVPNGFTTGAAVFGTDTTLSIRYQGHADDQLSTCLNDEADVEAGPMGTNYYVETWALNGTELRCQLTPPGGAPIVTQPLMNNVEAIQFVYGEDTGGDSYPDAYRTAANVASWAKVRSVVVSLRMVSDNNNLAEAPQAYLDFAGNNVVPNDRRLRRNVFTTVALRNTLP